MAQSLPSSIFLSSTPIKPSTTKTSVFKPLFPPKLTSPKPGRISSVHVASPTSSPITLPQPVPTKEFSVQEEEKTTASPNTCRTKFVCTVGPATCSSTQLAALAAGGMSVARLNMCHGTREWHRAVIERVKKINEKNDFSVAIMIDTEGSEIHMGNLGGASQSAKEGDVWTFTVRSFISPLPKHTIDVNYDAFAEDVRVGDEVLVDGGMVRFEVIEKIGPDVICNCIDTGLLLPRASITMRRNGRLIQERNAKLPTITSKDWLDIDFGISEGIDFIAVSFVKSAEVIHQLKSYIASRSHDNDISVIAKIENVDSLKNLREIVKASDGIMVARLDLGAQIPIEQVPLAQEKIIKICRELNKPVIVASQLLESMIEYPIPTRAEVADVSEAVRQKADALMLSGESAMGRFPIKALSVLNNVSSRMEKWLREEKNNEELDNISCFLPSCISKELCDAAAGIADKLGADALIVYTKTGQMASLLSRCRPNSPIYAFTPSTSVQRRLNLQWGLLPFHLSYSDNMKNNLNNCFNFLKANGMVKSGDVIVSVSDISKTIQVINVP